MNDAFQRNANHRVQGPAREGNSHISVQADEALGRLPQLLLTIRDPQLNAGTFIRYPSIKDEEEDIAGEDVVLIQGEAGAATLVGRHGVVGLPSSLHPVALWEEYTVTQGLDLVGQLLIETLLGL